MARHGRLTAVLGQRDGGVDHVPPGQAGRVALLVQRHRDQADVGGQPRAGGRPARRRRRVDGLGGRQPPRAGGQVAAAGVVADGLHVQHVHDLAGLDRVEVVDEPVLGVLPGGRVGVDHRAAASAEPAEAGADEGDVVAGVGEARGQPADLVPPAECGGRDGLGGRRDQRETHRADFLGWCCVTVPRVRAVRAAAALVGAGGGRGGRARTLLLQWDGGVDGTGRQRGRASRSTRIESRIPKARQTMRTETNSRCK